MKFSLPNGPKVELLGDPHLGRKFENGVPLHRRGEREAQQMETFRNRLNDTEADYFIMVGDLFDHPHVGYAVVQSTYFAIINAAARHPRTTFIFMAGNHDLPRNIETIGAFDLLATMLHDIKNLMVVTTPTVVDDIALFPWEWDRSAADQVEDIKDYTDLAVAVGHWDLKSFGGDDSHLAPTELLGDDIVLYSGHYHTPGEYKVANVVVHCTGSMEPYSHAEDPDGTRYVTLTLDELDALDPDDLKDKCVRVLLEEGQEMPLELNCMALTGKRLQTKKYRPVVPIARQFAVILDELKGNYIPVNTIKSSWYKMQEELQLPKGRESGEKLIRRSISTLARRELGEADWIQGRIMLGHVKSTTSDIYALPEPAQIGRALAVTESIIDDIEKLCPNAFHRTYTAKKFDFGRFKRAKIG